MEQQPHRICEQTKSKQTQNQVTSQSNWPRVLLLDLAHKECNGIIKGWLHCLTPESIARFLVYNLLTFDSAWCLIMTQIQLSLILKNKDWILATPHPTTSDNNSFFALPPPPPPPPQSGRHMCINPRDFLRNFVAFSQFAKREKHAWRSVTFSVVASSKSNTPPWMFFTFFY